MNELERLLAAVSRPEPSRHLDERVNAVLMHEPPGRPGVHWKRAWAWCGVAACAGAIGFYGGRQSVVVPSASVAATAEMPAPDPVSHQIVTVPLRQDQLASLFVQTATPERMLGRGPVRIAVSASPEL
jgi:hypothetical protein